MVCESWTDDLTAPPLHVRSWAPSLWLMTSCSELWVLLKGKREGGVLLADGRTGRSVGVCFRE